MAVVKVPVSWCLRVLSMPGTRTRLAVLGRRRRSVYFLEPSTVGRFDWPVVRFEPILLHHGVIAS